MFKHSATVIGFSLATLLALPALAQTNPSIEGYSGGHVQAQTAFQSVDTASASGASYTAGRLAANPGLEGYSGNAPLNASARYATAVPPRTQYAANPEGLQDDSSVQALKDSGDDFAWIEQRVRYSGR
ncbi:MAG: hypothetical protein ACQETX_11235 [Pseudomonadota bacterium]